jgi:RNA polymerase sigma factor (sigma-70 family)
MAEFPDSSHSEQYDPNHNEDPTPLYQIAPDYSIYDLMQKGEYMHLISREQLPGILRGIHEQKKELQKQIHELQADDLDMIEGMSVRAQQVSSAPLAGCGTYDAHDKVRDILVKLEGRKASVINSIEQCLAKYDIIKEILDAVDELPNDQRRIIKRCFFDGMSQTDLSKDLNIDRTTVYRKMQVALDTLYELLNRGEKDEKQ